MNNKKIKEMEEFVMCHAGVVDSYKAKWHAKELKKSISYISELLAEVEGLEGKLAGRAEPWQKLMVEREKNKALQIQLTAKDEQIAKLEEAEAKRSPDLNKPADWDVDSLYKENQ